jgi:NADH dehydrogenase (ubiquinone) Fe-S protein 6
LVAAPYVAPYFIDHSEECGKCLHHLESSRLPLFPFSYGPIPHLPTPTPPPQTMLSTRLAAAARLRPAFVRLSTSASSSKAVQAEAKPTPAVVPQSPNHAATWSTNQSLRPAGQSGPRFEQTVMELQPNPLSAMELIANEPIRLIHGRKTICDGGKSDKVNPQPVRKILIEEPPPPFFFLYAGAGPLGHPKIYINLVRLKRAIWDRLLTYFLDRTNLVLIRAGELTSI